MVLPTAPKIFFSYSRHDSAFALTLARDVREAGLDIWIDQLDIPAGMPWDSAVEQALRDAAYVLVILSPFSVASQNVMDEISFSLETGKKIIPVMLAECPPPLRLRRLQRIDFTKEYQAGLDQLLFAIRQNQMPGHAVRKTSARLQMASAGGPEDAEIGVHDETEISWHPSSVQVPDLAPVQKKKGLAGRPSDRTHAGSKSSRLLPKTFRDKWPVTLGGLAMIILLVMIWIGAQHRKTERAHWEKALAAHDTLSFQGYLLAFPEGHFAAEARLRMDSLRRHHRTLSDTLVMSTRDTIASTASIIKSEPLPKDTVHQVPVKKQIVPKKTVTKKPASKFTPGQYHQGGIIVYIDPSGEHGIIAAVEDIGEFTWDVAKKRCSSYKSGGYDDWILPTQDDLRKVQKAIQHLHGYTNSMYWSSTPVNADMAWTQNLRNGFAGNFDHSIPNKVRPVRYF